MIIPKIKISIAIPLFNEEGNIPELVKKLDQIVSEEYSLEFLLINNGSTDQSENILADLISRRDPEVFKFVNLKDNKGYGGGILAGLSLATGSILGWTHGDLQTNPHDLKEGLRVFMKADPGAMVVVKGKRTERDAFSLLFTNGMHLYSNQVLGITSKDINAQPKIFSRDFYNHYLKHQAPEDFSLDLYLLYIAESNGIKILDFPVHYRKRNRGKAKGAGSDSLLGKWKLMKQTFIYIHRLKSRSRIKS